MNTNLRIGKYERWGEDLPEFRKTLARVIHLSFLFWDVIMQEQNIC